MKIEQLRKIYTSPPRSSALVPLQSRPEQASHPAAAIFQQNFRANLRYFPTGPEKRFPIHLRAALPEGSISERARDAYRALAQRVCRNAGESWALLASLEHEGFAPEDPDDVALFKRLCTLRPERLQIDPLEIAPRAALGGALAVLHSVLSPDGRWIAAAGKDGIVRIWGVADGTEIGRIEHKPEINHLLFSPDSAVLASEETQSLMDSVSGEGPESLRRQAADALARVTDPAAIERICDAVIESDQPALRQIVMAAGFVPRDPARRALFQFLAEAGEPGPSALASAYDAAPTHVRDRVLDRLGRSLLAFIMLGPGLRPLGRISGREWSVVVAARAR